jgi:phage baseplate assembly protein W
MTARYLGLNARTGQAIADLHHIAQSLGVILTTPLGSRVMRRPFGSLVPDLLDRPLNGKTRMQVMAASVMAISAWEPRVELHSVSLQPYGEAGLALNLDCTQRDGPGTTAPQRLRIPLRA